MGRRQDASAAKSSKSTAGAAEADRESESEPTASLLRAAARRSRARSSSSACQLYKTAILAVVVPAVAIALYTYATGRSLGPGASSVLSAGVYPQQCPAPGKGLSAIERKRFHACGALGVKRCGRVLVDSFLSSDEVAALLSLATTGMSVTSGGSGGPTVLDMASGAVSKGERFVDVFQTARAAGVAFNTSHIALYRDVTERVRTLIAQRFTDSVDAAAELHARLHLTKPSFFTRITAAAAVTAHDEYWHPHVDRLQYGTFAVTALLYLNDYGAHFTGGRFVFHNTPPHAAASADASADDASVATPESYAYAEPRAGRLSFFTSGHENAHFVERVESGTRFALTIAFSCDPRERVTPKAFALLNADANADANDADTA